MQHFQSLQQQKAASAPANWPKADYRLGALYMANVLTLPRRVWANGRYGGEPTLRR